MNTERLDEQINEQETEIQAAKKLTRDIRKACANLGKGAARYLVDAYYREQKERIGADAMVRQAKESRRSFIQHKKSRIHKHSQWWRYQQGRREQERQEQERALKKLEAGR